MKIGSSNVVTKNIFFLYSNFFKNYTCAYFGINAFHMKSLLKILKNVLRDRICKEILSHNNLL